MRIKQLDLEKLETSLVLPENDEIHLFFYCLKPLDNMHKTISSKAHLLLRHILALYTGIPAESLLLTKNEHGKLFLGISQIHFNLSHSGNCIAFAFSTGTPVGIDIEKTNRNIKIEKVAERMFLPEEVQHLNSLLEEEKHMEFLRLWTRTESFLKGLGCGFHRSFKEQEIQQEYTCWTVNTYIGTGEVTVPDGYICSVAYCHSLFYNTTAPDRT